MTTKYIVKTTFYLFLTFGLLLLQSCSAQDPESKGTESKYPIAHIKTRLGNMDFWLYDETPIHKSKFIELANQDHYNQFSFNRVVKDFVIQGGCPDSVQYFEDSPFLIDSEFVDSLKHVYGALGMGRDDNPEKQSNACQFYIVNKESGLSFLDGNYTVFGHLINGYNVLELIEKDSTDNLNKPLTRIPLDVSIVEYTEQELLDNFQLSL